MFFPKVQGYFGDQYESEHESALQFVKLHTWNIVFLFYEEEVLF